MNKYLKLLLNSVLSKTGRFLIRNQHSELLRIQSQIFTDSEDNDLLTLSEPEHDIELHLDRLENYVPNERAERTLLKGLLAKPKDISYLDVDKQVSSLASLQESKDKSPSKKPKRSLTKKKTKVEKNSKKVAQPLPVMKSGSPQPSDAIEQSFVSKTISDQDAVRDEIEDNGFVKVHDAKDREGRQDSQSVANPYDIDNQLDVASGSNNRASLAHLRSGSLPKRRPSDGAMRETDDKAGGTEWEDHYQLAIGQKMTQLRMQASPMLDAASDNGSVVELNKLSQLLAKW